MFQIIQIHTPPLLPYLEVTSDQVYTAEGLGQLTPRIIESITHPGLR